jgi:hypothetical protein
VRVAGVEWDLGNRQEARTALSRVRFDRLEPADRRNAYRLLADLAEDPEAQVRWLALYRAELDDPAEIEATDAAIDAALVGIDEDGLERLAGRLGAAPPIARVWLSRAERALDADDLEAAGDALAQVRVLPLPPRYGPRLSGAVERLQLRSQGGSDVALLPTFADVAQRPLPRTEGAAGTLGVVLPLSGPYARFGEESLQGVLLATGIFGPGEVKPDLKEMAPLRVLVRDSGGDPQRAAEAVRELAEQGGVTAIVGPLLSAECEAAAGVAEELSVPLLALTSREEIAHLRRFVFRVRTRPVEETQLLAEKARELGAERFAILYRNDPYGRGLRSLFWQAIEARGGRVVGVASYDPKAHDFADPIRRIVGYTLLDAEQGPAAGRAPGDAAAGAAPAGGRGPRAAQGGPAADRQGRLAAAADRRLRRAVHRRLLRERGADRTPAGLPRDLRGPAAGPRRLVRRGPGAHRSRARRGLDLRGPLLPREPGALRARLRRGLPRHLRAPLERLRRPGLRCRQRRGVRDGILATHGYPGVAGVLSIGADGNAQKRPFLLGVEDGEVVEHDAGRP